LMQFEFKLPDIGEGIAEGEILKWMVKEGDQVKEDQSLVEVMTDKVNVQIPSPKSGIVSRILAKDGQVVKVGQVIVVIEVAGESGPSPVQERRQAPAPSSGASSTVQTVQAPNSVDRTLATPATRRLAREMGVEIATVRGSGPAGRVTDDDVKSAAGGAATIRMGRSEVQGASAEERVPLRGVRKAVAERMTKSSNTAAHVTVVEEVDMTELVLLKEAFKGSAEKRGVKLTFLPLMIKAIIPALKEFPYINSSLDDAMGEIVLKKSYNIGVATDTEAGLMVPVVKDADKKDIFAIAGEMEKLVQRARSGLLSLEEVHGSTFTITNIGSIGGLFSTPIINYPEVAIFGVHRITKRPVVRDGKIDIRDIMYASLSFDHRVLDGAYAARFMNSVIATVQEPRKLLAEIL
jgi:2-oxoglutarate dehydrogenase complex dihydrolipoamide succinyltransferase (E2) component